MQCLDTDISNLPTALQILTKALYPCSPAPSKTTFGSGEMDLRRVSPALARLGAGLVGDWQLDFPGWASILEYLYTCSLEMIFKRAIALFKESGFQSGEGGLSAARSLVACPDQGLS